MLGRWRTLLPVGLAVVLFLASSWVKDRALQARQAWPTGDDPVVLPEARFLPVLAMGYRELAADLLWARALVHGGADEDDTFHGGYLQPMLDGVFALDPQFEAAYRWAAHAVLIDGNEITQEGLEASVRYLEQAIREFPDDWEFHWTLGVRYWLDLEGDTEKERQALRERGAELIEAAMRKPDAPAKLATQAAAIRSELGQRDRALRELEQMILTTEDESARQALIARYRALADDTAMAAELERAQREFEDAWREELPYAPPDLFVLLGDAPPETFDLEKLAAPRDLFGAESMQDAAGGRLGLAGPGTRTGDSQADADRGEASEASEAETLAE